MKLIKYLTHRPTWHKLPPMPRQYSTDYDDKLIDPDTATLMQLTHIRSPYNVKLLKEKHNAASARQLIDTLPKRRRPRHIGKRALALVQRIFGLTNYDPMQGDRERRSYHARRRQR